jgi:hypothetical protein
VQVNDDPKPSESKSDCLENFLRHCKDKERALELVQKYAESQYTFDPLKADSLHWAIDLNEEEFQMMFGQIDPAERAEVVQLREDKKRLEIERKERQDALMHAILQNSTVSEGCTRSLLVKACAFIHNPTFS